MDAIKFLKQEHKKAKAAFEKVLKARPEKRGDLWEELSPELKAHEQIEDACLYGPLSEAAQGKDSLLAGWREKHDTEVKKVEGLISEIEELDSEEAEWLGKVKKVHASLETHIEEEESDIFPRISKVWDKARLEEAGADMDEMKKERKAA